MAASAKLPMALVQDDNGLTASKRGDMSKTRMSKPRVSVLNLDVVSCIMEHSDRPSISHLMKICHQYYSIGGPKVLRFPVFLRRLHFVDSFHDFMFAPSTTDRFRFLKDLRILEADNSSFSIVDNRVYQSKILRILSHSKSLEKVVLSRVDNFPAFYYFADEIRQLTDFPMLREIECSNSRRLASWLKRLRAPVTNLSFSLDYGDRPVRLLAAISHFRDTLRTLTIGYRFSDATDAGLRFPHVDHLTIQMVYPSTPSSYSASTIFRLFPNLKKLHFPGYSLPLNDVNLDIFQRHIQRYHHEHMVEADRDSVVDKTLEEASDCVQALYRGAYICRIKRLFLYSVDDISTQWLLPLLTHIRPSVLVLEFRPCDSASIIEMISSILREASTCNTLQYISLVFSFEGTENGVQVARSIMERLPETLQLAAITRVDISYIFATYTGPRSADLLENAVGWEEAVIKIILAVPSILSVEFKSQRARSFRVHKDLVYRARQKFQDEPSIISYIRSKVSMRRRAL